MYGILPLIFGGATGYAAGKTAGYVAGKTGRGTARYYIDADGQWAYRFDGRNIAVVVKPGVGAVNIAVPLGTRAWTAILTAISSGKARRASKAQIDALASSVKAAPEAIAPAGLAPEAAADPALQQQLATPLWQRPWFVPAVAVGGVAIFGLLLFGLGGRR